MLNLWKYRILEKMKNMLIEFVLYSEEDLLEHGWHIESFSFRVPNELKKLFFYASGFKNFMYMYYTLEVPITSKDVLDLTVIFYSRTYSLKPKKNPSEYLLVRCLENEDIKQPRLYSAFKFDVYTNDLSLDQNYIKKIASSAKIWTEKGKVEFILYNLPFEIKYKVYYI
jgi:hypothetical protein